MSDLPRGWKQSELGTLADVAIGGTPSRDISRYWATNDLDGQPWVAISDLQGRFVDDTRERITDAGIAHSNVKLVRSGTVLMSFKLSLGRVAFAGCDLYTNEAIAAFIANDQVIPAYLYYALPEAVRVTATDVAIKGATLNKKSLRKLVIAHPNPAGQEGIAAILITIDTAIEQTEALIEKYQHIKAGLMHDLFTRGVLPNGQLRPPREQAPELYQETVIGWIPKEWRLSRCIDLCSRICVGIVIQPTQYYIEDGVPALRSANVREEGIDQTNYVYISEKSNQVLSKSQLRVGDIVSVRTGYPGTSAVVPDELRGANCIDILISTPNGQVSSDYLCFWINSSFGKEQVLRQQGGMAQQHFNVGEMRELLVAVPSPIEQFAICERLQKIAYRLTMESSKKKKMQLQKIGIMQDLLTGKVPVKVKVKVKPDPSEAVGG